MLEEIKTESIQETPEQIYDRYALEVDKVNQLAITLQVHIREVRTQKLWPDRARNHNDASCMISYVNGIAIHKKRFDAAYAQLLELTEEVKKVSDAEFQAIQDSKW